VTPEATALAASVHQRLLNQSKALGLDFNLLLARYAIERFLYRLAQSPYADQFVLKGAILLQIWLPEAGRPTRDLDLLGFGDMAPERLRQIFVDVCNQPVSADGCRFDAESVTVAAIRPQDEYGGQRVTLGGRLGNARLHVQVHVGAGDRLTPPAEWIEYPSLLDLPQPRLRAYRAETAIAEKLHAMVVLDLQNSRMKDFFDVWRLAQTRRFAGEPLAAAVHDTFDSRRTTIPAGLPTALTQAFGQDPVKAAQWKAFLARSRLERATEDFADVIRFIADFLMPAVNAARAGSVFQMAWPPGGPWQTERTG
jgi:predicted nucleotidyltransferase component of viral defense system